MPDLSKDELLDIRISSIINSAEDAMFQKFDDLHKQNHNDDDVINYLRKQGYTDYADAYIEWSGALDPDVDPTPQGPELVTDPGNAPSYGGLGEQLNAAKSAASPMLSTPALDRFIQHARGEVK